MLRWDQLLRSERYDGSQFYGRTKQGMPGNPAARDHISVFHEDIERIIYSPAFRRLQGKTQVHPLPRGDFQRNRLTHSLEVSQIGRILSTAVAKELVATKRINSEIDPTHIPDVVHAACLIHDIGNPPFGHSGEEAIQSWFAKQASEARAIFGDALAAADTKFDFLHLDGNACGYRVVNRTQNWRNHGGLRLSAAAIGAFVKYPFSSEHNARMLNHGSMSKKKYGYFKQDEDHIRVVFEALGISPIEDGLYPRHPLVYLVEAADDICYHATDIEDGVRAGIIPYEQGVDLLRNCCNPDHIPNERRVRSDKNRYLAYLHNGVASTLIDDCYLSFCNRTNYKMIMNGSLKGDLISLGQFKKEIIEIEQVCHKHLHVHRQKMEVEAGGYHIVYFLLEEFTRFLEELSRTGIPERMDRKYRNLFHLLPDEIRADLSKNCTDGYILACHLVDYITGMSDRFAVDLYRKISGSGLFWDT